MWWLHLAGMPRWALVVWVVLAALEVVVALAALVVWVVLEVPVAPRQLQ